ncbi:AEC family transporter [soil metagenome]
MIAPILLNILGPILLMVALGALLRRKFGIDLATLSKLNIYLLTPAFIFRHVAYSKLTWASMGGIMAITLTQVFTLGILIWGIGVALGVSRKTLCAIALAVMFYNSGNYGLALAELAYPSGDAVASAVSSGAVSSGVVKNGGAAQAFVVLTQNVLTFTVGLAIAAWGGTSSNLPQIVVRILRLPVLYTLLAAVGAKVWLNADVSRQLPAIIERASAYLSDGLIPIALITVGVQLAANPRWPRWRPLSLALFLRLIVAPIQMAGLLWMFHKFGVRPLDLWPWPAELLILTAAVPTAINTLLLTLELGGDADLAADTVFGSTIFSCVTITGWLIVIRWMTG